MEEKMKLKEIYNKQIMKEESYLKLLDSTWSKFWAYYMELSHKYPEMPRWTNGKGTAKERFIQEHWCDCYEDSDPTEWVDKWATAILINSQPRKVCKNGEIFDLFSPKGFAYIESKPSKWRIEEL